MGFVIPKILDQLNVVWLFNVKQGFCLSKKLLLFGVVPNFCWHFPTSRILVVVSIIIQDMLDNNSSVYTAMWKCAFPASTNTTIPFTKCGKSSESWNFKTRPTVFFTIPLQPTVFFKQISQVKNLVINTGGLIFRKRVTKVSNVF